MKTWLWRVLLIVSLAISGVSASAQEVAPKAEPGGHPGPPKKISLQRLKAEQQKAEAQKVAEDEKARAQEKKDKTEKSERKTGHKSKSWQIQNR